MKDVYDRWVAYRCVWDESRPSGGLARVFMGKLENVERSLQTSETRDCPLVTVAETLGGAFARVFPFCRRVIGCFCCWASSHGFSCAGFDLGTENCVIAVARKVSSWSSNFFPARSPMSLTRRVVSTLSPTRLRTARRRLWSRLARSSATLASRRRRSSSAMWRAR